MTRWSEVDSRVVYLWHALEERRRDLRSTAQESARAMREMAETRLDIARTYEVRAGRATGEKAAHLRAQALYLYELADRAQRFAEKEDWFAKS